MRIRFPFHPDKAIAAMAFVLQRLGVTDKVKLMKLIYLADRQHFITHGFPITGDNLCAMRWGPVPSRTLDVLNGEPILPAERVYTFLHVEDNKVELRKAPDVGLLDDAEQQTLLQIIADHGAKPTWDLVHETHQLPEYRDCYVEGSSRAIPYEQIARHSGSEERFRLNRPVISIETAGIFTQARGPGWPTSY